MIEKRKKYLALITSIEIFNALSDYEKEYFIDALVA